MLNTISEFGLAVELAWPAWDCIGGAGVTAGWAAAAEQAARPVIEIIMIRINKDNRIFMFFSPFGL